MPLSPRRGIKGEVKITNNIIIKLAPPFSRGIKGEIKPLNKMKKILNLQTLLILAVLVLPTLVHANSPFDDDVLDTPIDGGLSLLVAAGVGYGAKKLKEKRSNKS